MFKDNADFYPTPKELINKMMSDVDFRMITNILEPSAGQGDIVDWFEEKRENAKKNYSTFEVNVECIESDSKLQNILRGKNYSLVHDDFLTYNPLKQYDLIVMNPPFSNGAAHLLKALELQKRNGGAVICLLNAETLKNPYSNQRKELVRLLEEYEASIEYISNAFSRAERTTDVEIALIKVILPKVYRESVIWERLKNKRINEEKQRTSDSNAIIETDYMHSIIAQYQMEIEAGIQIIQEYEALSPYIMCQFGRDEHGNLEAKGGSILKLDLNSNHRAGSSNLSINNYIREVNRKYWSALFADDKFMGKLTSNLRHEMYNDLDRLQEYEFSFWNITELKFQMNQKMYKGVEDSILDLFEELSSKYSWYGDTCNNIHYYNGWKTNKSYMINNKCIIKLNAYGYFGSYAPTNYDIIEKLGDIEKCFNYLGGEQTQDINLKERLSEACKNGETKNIQLKHFKVTFYQKGTCHITFTNLEALKKMNIFAGRKYGWLPFDYGKTTYNKMDKESKAVVDSFEGEKKYAETVAKSNYYIVNDGGLYLTESA